MAHVAHAGQIEITHVPRAVVQVERMEESATTNAPSTSGTSSSPWSGSASTTNASDSDALPRGSVSFLKRLRAPQPSELSRKRKVHANPPPVGKKRSKQTSRKFDPTSITPSKRVSEYPGEHLVESNRKLFCKACRETLAVKSSVVRNHVKSKKHADSKERVKQKQARERDIAEALRAHDGETHRKDETLPEEQNVYRVKVVIAFMKSGIPLPKLEYPDLRNLLEENGYRLTDRRHLLDMVPSVLSEERARTVGVNKKVTFRLR